MAGLKIAGRELPAIQSGPYRVGHTKWASAVALSRPVEPLTLQMAPALAIAAALSVVTAACVYFYESLSSSRDILYPRHALIESWNFHHEANLPSYPALPLRVLLLLSIK